MPTPEQQAAEIILQRRQARKDFRSWCQLAGYQPAQHHDVIISKCQEIADSKTTRYIMLMCPPGSAKSTYCSMLFPPWYVGHCSNKTILACSHSASLAETFGRRARNLVDVYANDLGFELRKDSKAAGEWETTSGGRYFCTGVGAAIHGQRADLGLIDDYLGNQEDADSKVIRDKQWDWFCNDFFSRLNPGASVIIIANRRHEDDLVGRLLSTENNESPIRPDQWEIVKFPFFAEENDVLGRNVGEHLWPERFDVAKATEIKRMPSRTRAGLYQQNPRPEDGNYFRLSWLHGYEPQDLPTNLRIYAASDHACSDKDDSPGANSTCLLFGGWDGKRLWILPTCWWEKEDTGKVVSAMLRYGKKLEPLTWWAEKGHISKSIGPFLRDRMQEEQNFIRIEEVVPVRDKSVRARSVQGMMEFGLVMFPKFAPWWDKAESELLTFPGGKSDDFVDALAHLGHGVNRLVKPRSAGPAEVSAANALQIEPFTLRNFHKAQGRQRRLAKHFAMDR